MGELSIRLTQASTTHVVIFSQSILSTGYRREVHRVIGKKEKYESLSGTDYILHESVCLLLEDRTYFIHVSPTLV